MHEGICCDACDMYPIARFRSLDLENFDLCSACERQQGAGHQWQCLETPGELSLAG